MAFGTVWTTDPAGMGLTETFQTNPKDWITQGRAANRLGITEAELVELLRKGTLKGLYNPPFSAEEPIWWVNVWELERFSKG